MNKNISSKRNTNNCDVYNKENVPPLRFPEFSDEWINIKIKDMAIVIGGGTPSTSIDEYWNGSINWFIPTEVGNSKYVHDSKRKITKEGLNNSSAKELPKNTILLTTRATIGRASITTSIATTNQGFQSLITKDNSDTEFLYYLIETIQNIMIKKSTGSTFLEISKKEVENINIKVPNRHEQQKIGKFLNSIDKRIDLTEKKRVQYKRLKQYLLQNLFPSYGKVIPKLRFSEFSGKWKSKKLESIADVKGGKRMPKGNSLINTPNNHPYITVSDMEDNTINMSNIKYVPEEVVDQIKKYTIYKDDIYISVAGTIGLVGKIPSILNGANLTENADKITNIKISQDFLLQYFQSDVLRRLIHRTKTDNAQLKLALREIRNLKVKYPLLSIEQEKIASILASVDKKIKLISEEIILLKKFKTGLLQKMFC